MPPMAELTPTFSLLGTDGRHHGLEDYADAEVLVIVQGCNHCPFVQAWEPRINATALTYADRGVQVLMINSNDAVRQPEDSFALMQERAAANGINYDYLHDPDQGLARALGSERTPEVFVFDSDRRLAYHGAVDDNRDETAVNAHYLTDAIEALLGNVPVAISSTDAVGCTIKWRETA
jgi:peroxiredoxin